MKRSTCMRFAASVTLALVLAGCDGPPATSPVVYPNADSLAMSPDSAVVKVGSAFHFTVEAFDSLGALIPANLAYTSSDPAMFTVDGNGRILGESEGIGTLIVASGAARDTSVVIVAAAERGWFAQLSGATGVVLHGVFFLPSGREGWVVGDAGRILRTLDGGAEWSLVTSGTSAALRAVWFTSDLEGWVVGSGGTVLRTTNGGTSWTRLSVPAGENLNDVQFATRDTGWVVGATGVVLRTFNRGSSWQRIATPTVINLYGVSFSGTRNGWAVGDNGKILGTHDRGQSWFTVPLTGPGLRGVWCASPSRANAAGANGTVPRTTASSDTALWQIGNAGASFDLYGVCFPTASIGFAVGSNGSGAILRSDDGGASWQQQQPSNSAYRLEDVFFTDTYRGWAVGANGVIVHTVTGGQP